MCLTDQKIAAPGEAPMLHSQVKTRLLLGKTRKKNPHGVLSLRGQEGNSVVPSPDVKINAINMKTAGARSLNLVASSRRYQTQAERWHMYTVPVQSQTCTCNNNIVMTGRVKKLMVLP
ncbi:hypothetical protein ElyMa_004469700 [Elysia marginata]|uniref:Uncharacterized protein n=1 Tax=Elysia marginata TaxID=1093978 RepID=A0AAV4HKE1_9GAST|nr:hypothetical protein ElyMa_004469700 [Elysia marginata]